jgi:hypothetical protein
LDQKKTQKVEGIINVGTIIKNKEKEEKKIV